MTRGLGGHAPANVTHHLKGVDFPADRDELLRCARENGAEDDVLEMIENMPDMQFESMADVMKGYKEAEQELAGESDSDDEDGSEGRTRH